MSLIAAALCVGCSMVAGDSGSGGPVRAGAQAACSACAPESYTCTKAGAPSATLTIENRTHTGCSGQLQGSDVKIECAPPTICYAGSCGAFNEDNGDLHFSIGSSAVVCLP